FLFTSFLNQVNAQTTTTKKNSTEQQDTKKYICPMHPEVVTDRPGKCPKCGMTLVEKTDTKTGKKHDMNKKHNMNEMHNMHNMNDSTVTKKDS
ncbi:MAG: hypothetical protein A2X05_05900, partial [Bacteroidetes bacterium GWE2_41_25]